MYVGVRTGALYMPPRACVDDLLRWSRRPQPRCERRLHSKFLLHAVAVVYAWTRTYGRAGGRARRNEARTPYGRRPVRPPSFFLTIIYLWRVRLHRVCFVVVCAHGLWCRACAVRVVCVRRLHQCGLTVPWGAGGGVRCGAILPTFRSSSAGVGSPGCPLHSIPFHCVTASVYLRAASAAAPRTFLPCWDLCLLRADVYVLRASTSSVRASCCVRRSWRV